VETDWPQEQDGILRAVLKRLGQSRGRSSCAGRRSTKRRPRRDGRDDEADWVGGPRRSGRCMAA
jgi:hypothetical protein